MTDMKSMINTIGNQLKKNGTEMIMIIKVIKKKSSTDMRRVITMVKINGVQKKLNIVIDRQENEDGKNFI